ncbi:MAG TPA: EthD family reductase [Candidatus Acidoferrum sp.]|nr:EthD family reductase [Candidatus Acidoferrum sp.]
MINVSVMYPNKPGAHFDISYYCVKHIPLVQKVLGPALLKVVVEEGIAGMGPGARAPYLALGHLYFESVGSFQEALGPQLAQIQADIPNYTNIEPTIQISNVRN